MIITLTRILKFREFHRNVMSEEKKESKVEAKPTEDAASEQPAVEDAVNDASAKAEAAAKTVEAAENAVKEAIAKAEAAKAEAESAAEEEYKVIAAEVKADVAKKPDHTFKRQGEEIFRREMGEPEFFLDKKDRFQRPILITRTTRISYKKS